MGFLRTLLYIFLFFYIIRLIGRFFFSYNLNKFKDEFKRRSEEYSGTKQTSREGEVIIDQKPEEPRQKTEEGEYIDYEEID